MHVTARTKVKTRCERTRVRGETNTAELTNSREGRIRPQDTDFVTACITVLFKQKQEQK